MEEKIREEIKKESSKGKEIKEKVYEVEGGKFVDELAKHLKEMPEFNMPDWANFVKTGVSRERPPAEKDWWHKRIASILRQLYIHKVVGVGSLRTRYGSKKDKGSKPSHFFKGGGKIIRTILQQAESVGLVDKAEGKKVGRKLTLKGKEFLNNIATSIK